MLLALVVRVVKTGRKIRRERERERTREMAALEEEDEGAERRPAGAYTRIGRPRE